MIRYFLAGITISACLLLLAGCDSERDPPSSPADTGTPSGPRTPPDEDQQSAPSPPAASIGGPPAESQSGDAEEPESTSSSGGAFRAIGRAFLGGIADAQSETQSEEDADASE